MSAVKRGRDKKSPSPQEKYTTISLALMQSEAWQALSGNAQRLYPWIKLEWRGAKFNNNGKISLSVRQAAKCLNFKCQKVSMKAFHDLQAKGFLVQTEAGSLGIEGQGKSPTYEITELAMPGNSVGRKLYKDWQEGGDFPIKYSPTLKSKRPRKVMDNLSANVIKMR